MKFTYAYPRLLRETESRQTRIDAIGPNYEHILETKVSQNVHLRARRFDKEGLHPPRHRDRRHRAPLLSDGSSWSFSYSPSQNMSKTLRKDVLNSGLTVISNDVFTRVQFDTFAGMPPKIQIPEIKEERVNTARPKNNNITACLRRMPRLITK